MTVEYPDEPVDGFPEPPRTVTDDEDREIELRRVEDYSDELVEMYLDFSQQDRAQGIPPTNEEGIRDWIEAVTVEDCLNVVAFHEAEPVGHVMLVDDGDGSFELAIFVLQEYQGAGIGTELVRTVLGEAQSAGIDRVWLSVERWNTPAVSLYKKIGFETTDSERFEKMMALRLA